MPTVSRKTRTISAALAALIILQGFCAAFFLSDLVRDLMEYKDPRFEVLHFALEVIANLALLAGAVVEAFFLAGLLRRQARADRALSAASGALHDLMEGYFADWGLTASEADVATFTIKGFTIAEVAAMRGSAEATVKTHLVHAFDKLGVDPPERHLPQGRGRRPCAAGQPPDRGSDARCAARPQGYARRCRGRAGAKFWNCGLNSV